MRALKIILTVFCVWFLVDFAVAAHLTHGRIAGKSLVGALICAAALYGVHRKTMVVWKLGWVYLGGAYISWVFQGLSLTRAIPQADSPRVAFAAMVIGGALVALYWGYWWKRQKRYFQA